MPFSRYRSFPFSIDLLPHRWLTTLSTTVPAQIPHCLTPICIFKQPAISSAWFSIVMHWSFHDLLNAELIQPINHLLSRPNPDDSRVQCSSQISPIYIFISRNLIQMLLCISADIKIFSLLLFKRREAQFTQERVGSDTLSLLLILLTLYIACF